MMSARAAPSAASCPPEVIPKVLMHVGKASRALCRDQSSPFHLSLPLHLVLLHTSRLCH